MQHLIEHKNDKHFIDNVRLAGEWGEENGFILKLRVGKYEQIDAFPVLRVAMGQPSAFGPIMLRYTAQGGGQQSVDIVRVIEVAWRPDIRRYAND